MRGKKTYEEDVTQGPSLTWNIVNYAVKLRDEIKSMVMKIGDNKYKTQFETTHKMLTSIDKKGSAAMYSKQLTGFI